MFYNSPICGNAQLLRSDSVPAPASDEISLGDALWSTGVETVLLNPLLQTTYSLFVRNSGGDQPLATAGLFATVYTSKGLILQAQPPPPCGDPTALVALRNVALKTDDQVDDFERAVASLGACLKNP